MVSSVVPGSDAPTCRIGRVWHVGTLNPDDKKRNSLEGGGLSVSQCPTAWTEIARLGGNPTWELTAPSDRGEFLDALALTDTERSDIVEWGTGIGFVERSAMWEVTWEDDELGSDVSILCGTIEEAETEAEFCEGTVTETEALIPTSTFEQRLGVSSSPAEAFDHLLTVWVEDTRPDLDGVWWHETLDPFVLSAPRGVIVPSRIRRWTVSPPTDHGPLDHWA